MADDKFSDQAARIRRFWADEARKQVEFGTGLAVLGLLLTGFTDLKAGPWVLMVGIVLLVGGAVSA